MSHEIIVDELYALAKAIEVLEDRRKKLKQELIDTCARTGETEFMGKEAKAVISIRENITYDPLKVYRIFNKNMPLFLSVVKVQNTDFVKKCGKDEAKSCILDVNKSFVVTVK